MFSVAAKMTTPTKWVISLLAFEKAPGKLRIEFELQKKVLLPPPLEIFSDIPYLEENFKSHLLRDVCTTGGGGGGVGGGYSDIFTHT